MKQALLGTVKRRDGRRQVTYNGWPLYYYAHEKAGEYAHEKAGEYAHEKAGEVKCQDVETHGGTWLVVRPSGALVR